MGHGGYQQFFNRSIIFCSKDAKRYVAIAVVDKRHHDQPWGYKNSVIITVDSANAIAYNATKNDEIKERGHNGRDQCLRPDTQNTLSLFASQRVKCDPNVVGVTIAHYDPR